MSVLLRWDLSKDINTRKDHDGYWGRGGTSIRYIGKGHTGEVFRTYFEFERNFTDISGGVIIAADLVLHTHEQGDWELGSGGAILCYPLLEDFDNNNEDAWNHEAWDSPNSGTTQVGSIRSGIPTSHNQIFRIDVLKYLARIAPSSVKVQVGTTISAGTGSKHPDHGLLLRSPDEGQNDYSVSVYSGDGAAPSTSRPYIQIEYEPANTPPTATWGGPLGAVTPNVRFTGTYYDPDGDTASAAQVQIWRTSDNGPDDSGTDSATRYDSKKVLWTNSWPDGQYDLPPIPVADALPRYNSSGGLITYEGRVRVWDSHDEAGPWTHPATGLFTVASLDPTVTPTHVGSRTNLSLVHFQAPWTFDPQAIRVDSYQVQLTDASDSGVWADPIWDQVFAPTAAEQDNKKADFVYEGPGLPIGTYSWRIRVWDHLGTVSAWAQDNNLALSQGTTTLPDPPDFTTVYGRSGVTTRLVMRAVDEASGHKRKPGAVVAIIENPYNLGLTGNATTPGQLYFSLPNKHPQISAMEPMRTHWALEQYRGGEWKELSAGLLTDFDATENDTVFNGLDYLGVLSLSIEAKAQPDGNAEASWDSKKITGAKYVNKKISYVIKDQLERCIAAPDSPLGFFVIPAGGVDAMNESVTIHSAYVQRLDFIRGLLDSHKGGASGRRSRITAAKNPVSGIYEFTVRSSAGKDRPNLRFEYGGLVQAYRVMALGDWADKVYGVGRKRNELKPYYAALNAPGVDPADWGEVAKAAVWQDISDTKDLTRRARQMATELSRAGKRIALGLRVHSVMLLDGWSICDNIQLDIEHGSVFTPLYGTDGWWTIWGWEWRLYPDGHDELTFVIKPTEGVGDPVEDLIPSQPIHIQPEWTVAHGPPTPLPPVLP
jgi:hypothetical protein